MQFQRYLVALVVITLLITLCGAHGEAQAAGSVTLSVAGATY